MERQCERNGGGGGRGGTVHCTALIIALEQRWEKEGRE